MVLKKNRTLNQKLNISEILKACENNNRQAQKIFVERFSGLIYAICIRYMGDREKAKDMVQVTLLKCLKKIGSYDSTRAKVETWISRIAINSCLNELKKISFNTISLEFDKLKPFPVGPKAIDVLSSSELLNIIKSLPDGLREVFNLAAIEGYSHKEIGEQIGIKEASSRSRLSRAKEILRKKLSNLKNFEAWIN